MADLKVKAAAAKIEMESVGPQWLTKYLDNWPLFHFRRVKKIEVEHLDPTPQSTDQWLEQLTVVSELEELEITGSPPITEVGLAHLSRLRNLRTLTIHSTRVADAGLEHLARMKRLRELTIVGVPVNALGLEHISRIENLEELYLDNNHGITDAALEPLGRMNNLRALGIANDVSRMRASHTLAELPASNASACETLASPEQGSNSSACSIICKSWRYEMSALASWDWNTSAD